MLTLDLFLYVLLGLYLDKIMPKEFGSRLSCFFCISPTYWGCCGRHKIRDPEDEEIARKESLVELTDRLTESGRFSEVHDDPDKDNFESKYLKKGNYEPVSVETAKLEIQNKYLMVKNIHKTYPSGMKAVNGINMKMYAGQIFALLGHNGAGKSSFISIITGLLERTRGQG